MKDMICTLEGTVTKGRQIGRTIGFPTANLNLSSPVPLLDRGVYGVIAYWKGHQLPGVMNIGSRPTFQDGAPVSYEVHLFDFDQNIYDEQLQLDICFFVRREMKFATVGELIRQIEKDSRNVRAIFSTTVKDTYDCVPVGEEIWN